MRFRIIISIVIEGAYVDSGIEKKLCNFVSIIGTFFERMVFGEKKTCIIRKDRTQQFGHVVTI